jgi:phosphoserine phosphatase
MATGYLKGIDEKELQHAAKIFVYQHLSKKIKPNIKRLLKEHKANGFTIILMSGSYNIIIEHVCAYYHADDFFASELEVVNSRYTGKYKFDQLFNKKIILLNTYQDITELVVISDNRTDYELMQHANKGYAVCNKHKQALFWESKNIAHVEIVK